MNGATALPCVSTMSAPKTASMMRTGSSQYFFRTLRKSHSSRRMEIMGSSELLPHRARGRARWPALDPVGGRGAVDSEPEGVLSQPPQHEGHRRQGAVEDERHDRRGDEPLHEQAEPEPEAVGGAQELGPENRRHQQQYRQGEGPGTQRSVPHEGPQAEQAERRGAGKTEDPVGGVLELHLT